MPIGDRRLKLEEYKEVNSFWFGELDENGIEAPQRAQSWFRKSDEFDAEIRHRFLEVYKKAKDDQLLSWETKAKSALALVIVLDQFPRNMFRDSAKAFATDSHALKISQSAISKGFDGKLPFVQKYFLYMPFMHSEDLSVQRQSLELFQSLIDQSESEKDRARYEDIFTYAERHYKIIEQFGRYPHRNEVLGRESTQEEVQFLKTPGSSF